MKTRMLLSAAALAGGILMLLAYPVDARPAATAQTQSCPPGQTAATCIKGTVITWEDPAHPAMNQLIQEDNSGAPQFWVGVGGAASGANPFCVTDRSVVHFVACLGGEWANGQGAPVLILYQVQGGRVTGRASLDYSQLAWLDRWLAARGVR